MLDKNELQKIINIPGEVKGVVFQTDANFILQNKGEAGLKQLEEQAKILDLPINYRETSALKTYPIGLRVASLLLIKDTFNFNDEEIRRMGYEAPKTSFVVKLLMKFLVSFAKLMKEVPGYWSEHYTVGSLESININDERKEASIYLRDIMIHPIFCRYLEGYFEKIYELSLAGKKGDCKEIECAFSGATSHHYELKLKQ